MCKIPRIRLVGMGIAKLLLHISQVPVATELWCFVNALFAP